MTPLSAERFRRIILACRPSLLTQISGSAWLISQSIILPLMTVEFVFAVFGREPMGWQFDISTESDAFLVTWELWSTWVPGMPPNG